MPALLKERDELYEREGAGSKRLAEVAAEIAALAYGTNHKPVPGARWVPTADPES